MMIDNLGAKLAILMVSFPLWYVPEVQIEDDELFFLTALAWYS
jgi:hypothetical protein